MFAKNSDPNEKKHKILLIVTLAVMCGFLLYVRLSGGAVDEEKWYDAAFSEAEEVSLSKVQALLDEPSEGRRAVVKNEIVYIEAISEELAQPEVIPTPPQRIERSNITTSDGAAQNGVDIDEEAPRYVMARLPFPESSFVRESLLESDFDVMILKSADGSTTFKVINGLFMLTFMGLIVFFVLNSMGKTPGGGMFGTENGFDNVDVSKIKTGIDQVAGLDNARQDVDEIIEFLKSREDVTMAGGRMPRGLLLDGPPGTGKTLLARAMAHDAGVNFIRVDASSLSQMFVGLGAMKVRRLFRKARKNAPAIIFIDEIDAIGGKRGGGGSSADTDRESTLNAILTELDGFEARDGIFLIAATNRAELLDPALTRPGRIDRRITLTLPDLKARIEILKVHCQNKWLEDDVDLAKIAGTTYQMSGADLENLVNEAALIAGKNQRVIITMQDFQTARDRIILPRTGGSITMMEDERDLTAVHEAGHAIAAILTEGSDPVEKVTIAPQGGALGFVLQSPDRDRVFETRKRLEARLIVAVAGRCAEEIIFGHDGVTTGASSDIRQATAIARAMVTQFGMSDLGFVYIDPNDPTLYDINRPVSKEIKEIIEGAIDACRDLLSENEDAIHRLSQALIERETIDGAEAKNIVAGGEKPKPMIREFSRLEKMRSMVRSQVNGKKSREVG